MSNKTPTVPDRNSAPTNGWDTVFAIHFDDANTAITTGWPNVNDKAKNVHINYTDPDLGIPFAFDSVFDPWQLETGGDGKNIRMTCPFKSGTYIVNNKEHFDFAPKDGKAVEVIIEVGMEWVPEPDQKSFVIDNSNSQFDTIKTDLDNNTIDAALNKAFADNKVTLSNNAKVRVVQNGKEWHLTDGDDATNGFYIFYTEDKTANQFLTVYQYEKSWVNNLKLLASAVNDDQPAVIVVSIANNPVPKGIAADTLPQLISEWFNDNIGEFNHVFAVLDLAPDIAKDPKYAWTKPTGTSYAVTDMGSMNTSIFGILTMAENGPIGTNHQVSQYAIPAGSDANGANAGFLIHGPDFVKYMLLPGAQTIFNNAPANSFEIINDHLTVQNTEDMIWGKFMMDNKKKGSIADDGYSSQFDQGKYPDEFQYSLNQLLGIYPPSDATISVTDKGSQWLLSDGKTASTEYILNKDGNNIDVYEATIITVQKGGFKMSLNHSYVEIEFVGLKYSYSSDFDVHINYTEQVVLTLQTKKGSDGKEYQIFWFDQVLKNLVVSVTKTKSAITREIVEGAVGAALALLVVAGPILEGLYDAAQVGEVTEEGGEAIVDAEAFQEAEDAHPQENEQDEEQSGEKAASQTKGKLASIKAAFKTPKWKMMGYLTAVVGGIAGLDQAISAIIEASAKNQWEHVPGFDDFAEQMIEPYSFPNVDGFDLKSAWLADSLQVGLKTKKSK